MPRYVPGAPDPANASSEAIAGGRRDILTQQMNAAEQSNRSFSQFMGAAQQGVGQMAEDEQMKRRESLEAARSGLEFDPDTRRYRKSQETTTREKQAHAAQMLGAEQEYRHREQQNLLKGGQAVQESKLAERAMTVKESEVGLKSRELGLEAGKQGRREALEDAKLALDLKQEERYIAKQRSDDVATREKSFTDQVQFATKRVDDLDKELRKVMGPASSDQAVLQSIAERMGIASQGQGGGWSKEQVAQHIRMERSRIILDHVALTGDMSLFNPTAPENREFLQTLSGTRAALAVDAITNPVYADMSYAERERYANSIAGRVWKRTELLRSSRQQQGGQQQQGAQGSKFMAPKQQGQQQQQPGQK